MIEKIDIAKISLKVAKRSVELMGTAKSESDLVSIISASILYLTVEEVNNKIDEINNEISDLKFKAGF